MSGAAANGVSPGIGVSQAATGFDSLEFGDANFILPVANLTRPEVLLESTARMNTKVLNLKLSVDQLNMLTTNPTSGNAVPLGVFLFMCQYGDACNSIAQSPKRPVHFAFPQSLAVAANSNMAWPAAGHSHSHSHCKGPIDLTDLITRSTECTNIIRVTYSTPTRWVAALVLSKRHTAKTITSEIRQNRYMTAEKVRQAFFTHASAADDDDLVSTGALVSLKCPLGLSRISTPVRSVFCQHSQCFDCEIFMQLMSRLVVWKCPVCSIVVKSWRELVVDGYFEAMLQGTSAADDQVYIEPNGEWRPKKEAHTPHKDSKPGAGRPLEVDDVDTIDLSDSSAVGYQSNGRNKRRRTEVVDLTLDSDGEGADDSLLNDIMTSLTQEELDLISSVEHTSGSTTSLSTNSSDATTLNNFATPNNGQQLGQAPAAALANTDMPTSRPVAVRRSSATSSLPTNGHARAAPRPVTATPARDKHRLKNKHDRHCHSSSGEPRRHSTNNIAPASSRSRVEAPSSVRTSARYSSGLSHLTSEADSQRNATAIANAVALSAARSSRALSSGSSGGASAPTATDWNESSLAFSLANRATALITRTVNPAPAAQISPRTAPTASTARALHHLPVTPIAPRLPTVAPNTVPRSHHQPAAPPAAHRSHSHGNLQSQNGSSDAASASSARCHSKSAFNVSPVGQPARPVNVGVSPSYSSLFLGPRVANAGSTAGGTVAASDDYANELARYLE
ncbi:E3 SUMO-protein ligase pli1 [Coemansia sp. RSA 2052]|nr:E3 SUMO-protein ligase pli1 [Coemansia sp. RSA 2052]